MRKFSVSRRGAISSNPYYQSTYRHKRKTQPDSHGLTETQVEAFREVFNLFDINGGGTIDAGELDSALQSVEVQLTHQEIHDVLQVIDEDGNGEIDFDEFLALMTSTEKYLETVRSVIADETMEKKENLLFTALTKFMRKSALSTLSEIERYYSNKVRKSPHVVGHYAAGARLIGLTEKQMAKHWATLNVTGDKNASSPYAQPACLPFNLGDFPKFLHSQRSHNGKIKLTITSKVDRNDERTESPPPLLKQRTVSDSKLPIVRNKGRSLMKKPPQRCSSCRLKIDVSKVPLPAVKIGLKNQQLTIEHLPMIRKEVLTACDTFHQKRNEARENALTKQDAYFTSLEGIPSRSMQLHYIRILKAYNFKPAQVPAELQIHHQPWEMMVI